MKKIFAIITVAVSLLTIASCEKYEDGRPPKNARNEFDKMYPNAFDIEWDYEGFYWEVSFETGSRPNGIEHEAKFDLSGNWIETVTEMFFNSVPQAVKDAFNAEYGNVRVDDNTVDFVQTPAGDFYRFEIMLGGVKTVVEVKAV